MYGLVNQAIQGLVTKEFGESKWQEIKTKAGFNDPIFVSMKSYDDAVTYNLVGTASEVLQIEAPQLLELFGEYWVRYTAEEGYGEMLDMAGSTFVEFLNNLNLLHRRVGDIMPNLAPPMFECTSISDHEVNFYYSSHREGLTPMVIGLIKGLSKRFELSEVVVKAINEEKIENLTKTTFNIKWKV